MQLTPHASDATRVRVRVPVQVKRQSYVHDASVRDQRPYKPSDVTSWLLGGDLVLERQIVEAREAAAIELAEACARATAAEKRAWAARALASEEAAEAVVPA